MALSKKIKSFFDVEKVKYQLMEHPIAYTAQEVAGAQHVPGKQVIKTVVVRIGSMKEYVMCILPAIYLIDFKKLQLVLKKDRIELAGEDELKALFPDYETGAEPPFGALYGLPMYAEKAIEKNDEVVFNAGTHTQAIKMKTADFMKLAKPIIAEFGRHI